MPYTSAESADQDLTAPPAATAGCDEERPKGVTFDSEGAHGPPIDTRRSSDTRPASSAEEPPLTYNANRELLRAVGVQYFSFRPRYDEGPSSLHRDLP